MTAEQLLGPRSTAYQIGHPIFVGGGPRLRFRPDGMGVCAELSLNAATYWPTLVFELAHETIHLLDPVQGYTNAFEEGIATEFQLWVAPALSGVEMPITVPAYTEAQDQVRSLGISPFEAAHQVRLRCGALSRASANDLNVLFPSTHPSTRDKLAAICSPR